LLLLIKVTHVDNYSRLVNHQFSHSLSLDASGGSVFLNPDTSGVRSKGALIRAAASTSQPLSRALTVWTWIPARSISKSPVALKRAGSSALLISVRRSRSSCLSEHQKMSSRKDTRTSLVSFAYCSGIHRQRKMAQPSRTCDVWSSLRIGWRVHQVESWSIARQAWVGPQRQRWSCIPACLVRVLSEKPWRGC